MRYTFTQLNGTTRTLRNGQPFTDSNGVLYSSDWGRWSEEDKITFGLVPVVEPEPVDNRFYFGRDKGGKPLPKDLDQLKANAILQANQRARSMLEQTDWQVIRGVEDPGRPVTPQLKTHRDSVRSKAADIEAVVTACTTLDELIAVYGDSTFNEWPEMV